MDFITPDSWKAHTLTSIEDKERVATMRELVGVDQQSPDYRKALETINHDSGLGLDEKDIAILELVYTSLSRNAKRFGGNVMLDERYKGDSASHSIMTGILIDKLFQGLPESYETTSLRHDAVLGILMHDVGEICGEFSSFSQRVHNPSLQENAELELLIIHHALRLAAVAVEHNSPELFYRGIESLKKLVDSQGPDISPQYLSKQIRETNLPALSEDSQHHIEKLAYYAQLAEAGVGYRAHLIKNADRTQALKHLMRFMEKGDFAVALRDHDSRWMMKFFEHREKDLGNLFAASSTPMEFALAERWRDYIYQSISTFLEKAPTVIDRTAPKDEPPAGKSAARQTHINALTQRHRAARTAMAVDDTRDDKRGGNSLLNVETRYRLMSLYRKAIEVGYIPKSGEVLAKSKTLPPDLQGLYSESSASLSGSAR